VLRDAQALSQLEHAQGASEHQDSYPHLWLARGRTGRSCFRFAAAPSPVTGAKLDEVPTVEQIRNRIVGATSVGGTVMIRPRRAWLLFGLTTSLASCHRPAPSTLTSHVNAEPPSTAVAISRVTVIDGTGAAPQREVTVVMRGHQIESITPADRAHVPDGAAVVEGDGKFLVPGFIDTHMHIASIRDTTAMKRLLASALAHGVTGLRDASASGREQQLIGLRERIERGEVLAPRLYVSGSGTPQNVPRHNAASLADLVGKLRELGVDGIKLRNLTSIQADTVIRQAKAVGLPVFGHTYGLSGDGDDDYTLSALAAGASGVMHLSGIGPAAAVQPRTLNATDWHRRWLGLYLRWIDATEAQETRLLDALVASGAWLEPTLVADAFAIHEDRYRHRQENRLFQQLWNQSYKQARAGFPTFPGSDLELARQGFTRMQAFVRRFHEAGGLIVTGTDMLPWPTAGLQEELRLLVDAGLSPLAALQAATRNAAKALGWGARTGTIEVGRDADLVLLDGDPLQDITNTQRIRIVVRAGRVLPRAQLDSILALPAATRAP
jgi:imidazolonepropionase-like amidohydrolase